MAYEPRKLSEEEKLAVREQIEKLHCGPAEPPRLIEYGSESFAPWISHQCDNCGVWFDSDEPAPMLCCGCKDWLEWNGDQRKKGGDDV